MHFEDKQRALASFNDELTLQVVRVLKLMN